MADWILFTVFSAFIPAIMLIYSVIFLKRPPKKINSAYGYRSRRSMKSPEAWKFAHFLCAKIWLFTSIVLFVLSVAAMLFVLGKDENTVGLVFQIVMYVQLAILILTILPVELALKKEFDENGNRKSPKE